jgi:hypothetical protein
MNSIEQITAAYPNVAKLESQAGRELLAAMMLEIEQGKTRESRYAELVEKNVDDTLKLSARLLALVAENAGLKNAFGPGDSVLNFLTIALRHTTYDQIDLDDVTLAFKMSLPETPATDRFISDVKAQGVEAFADALRCPDLDVHIREFAQQLRGEGKA